MSRAAILHIAESGSESRSATIGQWYDSFSDEAATTVLNADQIPLLKRLQSPSHRVPVDPKSVGELAFCRELRAGRKLALQYIPFQS
ncbi:hypothetical protein GCM10010869_05880 [Mesorhizobium tianshanense]|nr:hypothetical protein GCM10010869_05880 [Mesorhizobium tianshanense]